MWDSGSLAPRRKRKVSPGKELAPRIHRELLLINKKKINDSKEIGQRILTGNAKKRKACIAK